MLCVLLSYIFLVGPEAFQYYAQGAVQYGDLSTAAWGNDGDVFSYCYDANGSQEYKFYGDVDVENYTPQQLITNHPTIAYDHHVYNLQNRLARIEKYNTSHTLTEAVEYQYNSAGIRTAKIENQDGSAVTTCYLIDPSNPTGYAQVLEETVDDGTSTLTRTAYTIGDDVLAQTMQTSANGGVDWTVTDTQYLLYDGHGSARQLVDGTQTIDESYSYDAYGVMLSDSSGADAASNAATSLLYSGEQYDGSADQYYLRARYYNPANGLFNRMDPYAGNMQDPQSLHKYAYVHNNPVNGIDPTGMFGDFSIGGLLGNITIRKVLTFGMATTIKGAIIRAVGGMAFQLPVVYFSTKILPPLIEELKILSNNLKPFNSLWASKVSSFADSLEWSLKENWFFFTVAPLTVQVPIIHGGLVVYRMWDFFTSINTAQTMLLEGVTKSISTTIGEVNIDAYANIRLQPHSRIKIAKQLITGELNPADDVKQANILIEALGRLDFSTARNQVPIIWERVEGYGTVEGIAEADISW